MAGAMDPASQSLEASLHRLLPPDIFLSALSLELALALVGVGADDVTLKELQAVFGFANAEAWAQTLGAKIQTLLAAGRSGDPILAIANRVFAKCTVRPEHAAAVVRTLGAEVERLESEQQVNGFVERETCGMIKRVVSADSVQNSKLIAVNAIYFKGKWKQPFQTARTTVAPFYPAGISGPKETCHLMESEPGKQWEYHEDASGQYLLLPYLNGHGARSELCALVFLPAALSAHGSNPMSTVNVGEVCRRATQRAGAFWLPRFKVEAGPTELKEAMQALGVRTAFDDSTGHFPHVSTMPLNVDSILQSVAVAVDEQGTEAAAVTADCCGGGGGMPVAPFHMRCDRPFGFAVVQRNPTANGTGVFTGGGTGVVLFSGNVVNPGVVGTAPSSSAGLMSMAGSGWATFPPGAGHWMCPPPSAGVMGMPAMGCPPSAMTMPSAAMARGMPMPTPVQPMVAPNRTVRPAAACASPTTSTIWDDFERRRREQDAALAAEGGSAATCQQANLLNVDKAALFKDLGF